MNYVSTVIMNLMHFKRMKDNEFIPSNFIFMVSILICNLMPFKNMKEYEFMYQPLPLI